MGSSTHPPSGPVAGWVRRADGDGTIVLSLHPSTGSVGSEAVERFGWDGTPSGSVSGDPETLVEFAERHGIVADPELSAPPGRRRFPRSPVDVPGWGDGIVLTAGQAAAVETLTGWGGGLLADDVGLGKTFVALASAAASGAARTVVVVKAGLKSNWVAEAGRALGWSDEVLVASSRKPNGLNGDVRLVVINPEIFGFWVDALVDWGCDALLVDEGHFLANPDTKRSQATVALADHVRSVDGFVTVMTASLPPGGDISEMWTSLVVLGAADQFGTRDEFLVEYGAATHKWGQLTATPIDDPERGHLARDGLRRLSTILVDSTMVRRSKHEVLPALPMPTLHRVTLDVDTVYAEQEPVADHTLARWLTVHAGKPKGWAISVASGDNAGLVRHQALSQIAVAAKLDAGIRWIERFLDGSPEKKLIVFARHRGVQRVVAGLAQLKTDDDCLVDWGEGRLAEAAARAERMADRFGTVTILAKADQSAPSVEKAKAQFQSDPECRLMVCSISAAAEGHTLTAAWDVAFVQPPATPAQFRQCVGRAWGRLNDPHPVDVWFLLGASGGGVEVRTLDRIGSRDDALRRVLDASSAGS